MTTLTLRKVGRTTMLALSLHFFKFWDGELENKLL